MNWALIVLSLLASIAEAHGDVDLNGPWAVTFIDEPGFAVTRIFNVVQTGSTLALSCGDPFLGPITATGTIDPGTGLFTASGSANATFCPTISITGAATADDAFTATFSCSNGRAGELLGSRCGNQVVDFAEECDGVALECCDETCHWTPAGGGCQPDSDWCTLDVCDASHVCTHPLAPAGTLCVGDANECTDDVCDASGACTHPIDDSNICSDGTDCTENDECAAGVCSGVNRPAGSSCRADANSCTADTCDGAGTCIQGPCSPCCDPIGCVPQLWSGCAHPTVPSSKLLMQRNGESNHRFRWKWTHGEQTSLADFGTPLTSTDFLMCVYGEDEQYQLHLQFDAVVPGGGTCAGDACWTAKGTVGFAYKDATESADGISRIDLRAGGSGAAKILVKGKGPNLKLEPISIGDPATVQLRASNGQCWEALYQDLQTNGDDLRASKGQ